MAPPKLNRTCSIPECGRKHAAHGYCLMHYKRVARHGTPEYRWGGKVVGRACDHCDRPAVARGMCERHYQMWHRHGDPLYADARKKGGLRHGLHQRRGYLMECPVASMPTAVSADARTEKTDRPHAPKRQGLRDGLKRSRREWQHRKIAAAVKGQIVHHIDVDPSNNSPENLHVFNSPSEHAKAHRSLEKVAGQMVRLGIVRFDPIEGVYLLTQSAPADRGEPEQP